MKNAMMVLVLAGCGSVDKSDTVVDGGTCDPEACTLYCSDQGYYGACEDDGCHCFGGTDADADADTDADTDVDADSDSDTGTVTFGYGTDDLDGDGDVDGVCVGPETDSPTDIDYEGGEPHGTVHITAEIMDGRTCQEALGTGTADKILPDYPSARGSVNCNAGIPPSSTIDLGIFILNPGCYVIEVLGQDAGGTSVLDGYAFAEIATDGDAYVRVELWNCGSDVECPS
jgi:hypothetical protein